MNKHSRVGLCALQLSLALSSLLAAAADTGAASGAQTGPAAYTADGRLKFPEGYREWIYLSSGLDMSYRKRAGQEAHSTFDNVFVDPAAYRSFVATGTWPEGTMLVMEVRDAADKGSINQSGRFQSGEPLEAEVHLKDTHRFAGGWAFFAFGGKEPAAQIPASADCYACHREHGAVDTTFVQFYPTLLKIAQQHGTLKGRP